MLSRSVLLIGSPTPPPDPLVLRAGPLALLFEPGGAFLRRIRLGEVEVLRGIYAAVRDRNWGTVAPVVTNLVLDAGADSFRLCFDVACREREIDFAWQGTVTGEADGTVTYRFEGEARSTFLRNRIGFCVLHPIRECAGRPCRVEKVSGVVEDGLFPEAISPHQPFVHMHAIAHEVAPGVWAEVRFTGDVFEMEDQRNWSDASFKTYCTPLALPFPVEVPAGTRVVQEVTLRLGVPSAGVAGEEREGEPSPPGPLSRSAGEGELHSEHQTEAITLGVMPFSRSAGERWPKAGVREPSEAPVLLPRLGLGVASHGEPLTPREIERLQALRLSHLRVDLHLSDPAWLIALGRAAEEAHALGASLEVALFVTEHAKEELCVLSAETRRLQASIAAWLLFHEGEKATGERWVRLAREQFGAGAPVVAGTDAYFAELNRGRPPSAAWDGVCYSLNPQVHAFDERTLMENLAPQAETVRSARRFAAGRPIAVTPVTLRRRYNADATGPEPQVAPGELPMPVDPRQLSLFGAAWTLGSLKYLAESGAGSVTYYETTGWRGVMERETGSPLPERFPSLLGSVFPLYHVLADVGEFRGGVVVPCTSDDPLRAVGLCLRRGKRTRVLVVNLTAEPQEVRLDGLAGPAQVRTLDETTALAAMTDPEGFRAQAGREWAGEMRLALGAYAVVSVTREK